MAGCQVWPQGIAAGAVKGGTLEIARNPAQAARLAQAIAEERSWGVDVTEMTKEQAAERIRFDSVVAAHHTPHCARIQPARLACGLAQAVEQRGVTIYEDTPVTEIASGRAVTSRGTVRAPIILSATEGFTPALPGLRRTWLPMNSSMIATDPIPAALWHEIGWEGRETVGDSAHGFFYAQRTVDDRIAIGCSPTCATRSCRRCGTCRSLMAGAVGSVSRATGRPEWSWTRPAGSAGPAAMSDTASPRPTWPGVRSPIWSSAAKLRSPNCRGLGTARANWEPEPLRWLGVRGLYVAYKLADRHEAGGRARISPIARVADVIARKPH